MRDGGSSAGETIDSPLSWSLRGIINEERGEINVTHGKIIGWSGSINGQVYLRRLPEDFENWASWGNDEWTYPKVLSSYYRKAETDMDIRDDFHGTGGTIPILRREKEPWPDIQTSFCEAGMEMGYKCDEHMNGPNPSGIGAISMNNRERVRMSTDLSHSTPMRHRLNLTIKGNLVVLGVASKG